MSQRDPLIIAVPKGRVLKALVPLFESAGLDTEPLTRDGRALVRKTADGSLAYLLLKPGDIPTYVESGAATLGVVGRDVLREYGGSLYVPVDLGIARCQMCVCAPEQEGASALERTELRVATKFPNVARAHFAARGVRAETIYLGGSVELAPITGLADVIVDIVETGRTLKENGLVPIETIFEVSTVVIANPVGLKLQHDVVAPLLARLRP